MTIAKKNKKLKELRPFWTTLWYFSLKVVQRYDQDRCARVAGALSYTTFFALVPLTAVAFSVLSIFPLFQSWMEVIENFIYGNFVPAASDVVRDYLGQFANQAGKLTAFGLLFLTITAIMLMATIEQTFNDIWRIKQNRKLLQRFLTYWAILTLGPILIGMSLSITSYLISLPLFSGESVVNGLGTLVLSVVPFLFELLAFILLYTLVPNVPVKWRHALIGGLLAGVLFEIAKRVFALFVLQFSSYQVIYGAVAALPVFLIWIYLSWVIILIGAIVTASLPAWRTKSAT